MGCWPSVFKILEPDGLSWWNIVTDLSTFSGHTPWYFWWAKEIISMENQSMRIQWQYTIFVTQQSLKYKNEGTIHKTSSSICKNPSFTFHGPRKSFQRCLNRLTISFFEIVSASSLMTWIFAYHWAVLTSDVVSTKATAFVRMPLLSLKFPRRSWQSRRRI